MSTNRTCGTCRRWRSPRHVRVEGNPTPRVSNPDVGYCSCDKFVAGWVYKRPNVTPLDGLAHIDNLNHWVSTFETGRFFGCIHWNEGGSK